MNPTFRLVVCLLSIFLVQEAAFAERVRIEGVDFERTVTVRDTSLELHGVGLLRYRVVFRAYVGALYLAPNASLDALRSGDSPIRLELEYFWPIAGKEFGPAAAPYLQDNLTAEEYERIRARAEQLGALYRDVEPGDRYALTYIPGVGTELALNGKPIGVIEGDDFATAYFRVWLGERPIDRRFRDQLRAER